MESVTIGITPVETSGLIFIAEEQGRFTGNGLNVTFKHYDLPTAAIKEMKKGGVDICLSTEYPIVTEALNKQNISVIASIDKYQSLFLVARKDREIENVSDLKGKRIGVPLGTIREFYLGRFLELHGVSLQDVAPVDLKPGQYVDAITSGGVDGVLVLSSDVDVIKDRLSENMVVWPSQSSQPAFWVISCRRDWAAGHPEAIKRLLKSVAQAENFYLSHPDEALAMIQKKLKYEDAFMMKIKQQHQYSLSLDQSLIIAMEDEARWMIKNNLTGENKVPDFLDYINADGLKAIKPQAMNIIR